jgi:hypothetical protein
MRRGVRDTVLFFGGLAGVIHETLLTNGERVNLLIVFAAMMGLPAFLRSDEARQKKDGEDAADSKGR